MKVYVVNTYNHILGENEGVECVGVFSTLEQAQTKMKAYAQNEAVGGHWVIDKELEGEPRICRLFWGKQENWTDYFEIIIFEEELV